MTRWRQLTTTFTLTAALTGALLGLHPIQKVPEAMAATVEGFGSTTKGGAGQPVYRVTTLKDYGSGSLRDAVSKGYRYIVFSVAGEIALGSDLWVRGPYLTIDGTTAPAPGITLKNRALLIHGSKGAHDVIVRGIRSRNATGCDSCSGATGVGIGIGTDTYNVVLDRVSIQGYDDQGLSVDKGAHNVTIQWSIFAEGKNPDHKLPALISGKSKTTGAQTRRVSFHHNLVVKGYERMPYVTLSSTGEHATDLQLDMRNNVVWDWVYAGTQVWRGARANVINNYYYDPDAGENGKHRAIYFCKTKPTPYQCDGTDSTMDARAYIRGNVSGHGAAISTYLNSLGTESYPFSAAAVATTDACTAAYQVVGKAGVRPLDSVDQRYLSLVKLVGCAAPVVSSADSVDLEGEDFDGKSSNVWLATGEGGDGAIAMNHNAWTAYTGVDFDGLRSVSVRVASGNQGGTISFRTGSPTGPVIGSLSFGNTGGWSQWVTRTATLQPTAGTQTLYLTFTNATTGGGQMMLLDWFELVPSEESPKHWADYAVSLKMWSKDDDIIGVMFRYQDDNNYYRFSWDKERANRRLVKRQGGAFTLLAEDAVPYVAGRGYQVAIVADGATLEVWIDGARIFSVADTSFREGSVALYNWYNGGSYFDDVVVTDLDTDDVLLSADFNDGKLTDWSIVDAATLSGPSAWSVVNGALRQSANAGSKPDTRQDLTKLGTYVVYSGPDSGF